MQMEKEEKRQELCNRILQTCRAELCDLFPYLDSAFAFLGWRYTDLKAFGVDGNTLWISAQRLLELYSQDPNLARRGYLHMLLHCLFLHLCAPGDADAELWELACDIAVEQLIEREGNWRLTIDNPVRRDCFARMGEKTLSAEQILAMLLKEKFPYTRQQLHLAFHFDDHRWGPAADEGVRRQWERLLTEAAGKKAGQGRRGSSPGSMEEMVSVTEDSRYDYRKFLQRFTFPREEVELDPESFDYVFYNFGMEYYGSMPLIEPLEYKEVRRLEELVIAIDTSGSCTAEVVSHFLAETYSILTQQENFFRKMKVYFIQCDCVIQDVALIRSREDWMEYMKTIRIQGRSGTSFTPVFEYVQRLREKKELKDLKALLYFTDGDGAYPSVAPDYETAFVLLKETGHRELIPKWGRLLLI